MKKYFLSCFLSVFCLSAQGFTFDSTVDALTSEELVAVDDIDNIDHSYSHILNKTICKDYKADKPLKLKEAINITVACNRNIQKAMLNRISENYSLSVSGYKFKPNANISTRANYEETDNDIKKDTNKVVDIIPQFRILTPIGTIISLDWENHAASPNDVQTFRNATRITLRQPLLKQSGLNYQTASVKNAIDNNKLQALRLFDYIENEINKTIFLYRQIIQHKNQLDIQETTLGLSNKLLDQTKTLITAGRLAEYERTQVESQVASQEVNLADAKINLKKSYLQLANQLGINSEVIEIATPASTDNISKPLDNDQQNLKKLFKTILNNNINYQNLLTQQRITQRDYYTAYDQSRWTLDLTASYQIEGIHDKFSKSIQNQYSFSDQRKFVGLQFDVPIDFNPARNQALLENKIRIKQLELDKKQLEQEILLELQNQLYQQRILWDKLQLSNKSVQIKLTNFDMARKKYEVGRLSSFELVRIQSDVESARVMENSNLISYLNNVTVIDKILNKTLSNWGIVVEIA